MSSLDPLVVPTSEMSDGNLIRHLNARHPGLYQDPATALDPDGAWRRPFELYARGMWEILHERLHRSGAGHRHSD